eukprot:TRINITY_DN568_c0_g1_i2.p1 TRINITY_DN568_c0_g1~~TRINITY_DN568_c0_g1_i2.p1  ORF type:complete len:367 (+),score=43.02 TRINITY_DN568_c0_g1_i2:103-1203(+)
MTSASPFPTVAHSQPTTGILPGQPMNAFDSGESIYDLVPPEAAVAPHARPSRAAVAQLRAKASAPPSYSTLGLLNSTKIVANAQGDEVDIDGVGGGAHPVKAGARGFGREVKREIEPSSFLRRGTGNPASDSLRPYHTRAATLDASYGGGEEGGLGGSRGGASGSDGDYGRLPPLDDIEGGTRFTRRLVQMPKPSVPAAHEAPLHGLVSDKDFVAANAIEAAASAAKKRHQQEAPVRAVDRKDFGKVPAYIARAKADAAAHRGAIAAASHGAGGVAGASAGGADGSVNGGRSRGMRGVQEMSDEERSELLAQLRAKWAEKNRQYQQLSFRMDTQTKVQRKERLERELEQVEAYIAKLSKQHVVLRP